MFWLKKEPNISQILLKLWLIGNRTSCRPIRSVILLVIKVIPLFCTAHPLLRIILWHPRWRQFFPLALKEQTRAAFAKAFIRNNNAADCLKASWFSIEKQENERNGRDPEVCSGFSLCGRRVVELLKCPGWGFGLWGLWSLWDSSTALQLHSLAWNHYCEIGRASCRERV